MSTESGPTPSATTHPPGQGQGQGDERAGEVEVAGTAPAAEVPVATAAVIHEAPPGDSPSKRARVHMRRASALVAEGQLAEAEGEIVRGLEVVPDDLRALKLLALVRFRLGRLAEAGEAYRRVTAAAPDDWAARLNLGLIALKLERFEEAARELGVAVEHRPEDKRAQGYLAYALARQGQRAEAAVLFRRAGQPEVAAQLEAQIVAEATAAPAAAPLPADAAAPGLDTAAPAQEAPVEPADDRAAATTRPTLQGLGDPRAPEASAAALSPSPTTLATFVFERMVNPETLPAGLPHVAGDVLRLAVEGEATVSAAAVLLADGGLTLEPALRRRRGHGTGELLVSGGVPFHRYRGEGELWLSAPERGAALSLLELEEDILFLRESLVRGFAGALTCDSGTVPRAEVPVMHFQGSGHLLVDWGGADLLAVRLTPPRRLVIPEARLLGWLGNVVAHAAPGGETGVSLVACEGEGVLLIARHGQPRQPVHQPAQPGHDGAGGPDPGDALLHR